MFKKAYKDNFNNQQNDNVTKDMRYLFDTHLVSEHVT